MESTRKTWGHPINAYEEGYSDVFVAKLDSNGETVWNTFIGSPYTDFGYDIAVDGSGNVYVVGESWQAWDKPPYPVNEYTGNREVFAAKLLNNGTLDWYTFMGSAYYDYGYGITVDENGNVYVTGRSSASWGNPVNDFTGSYDAFVAKLNSSGETVWNTFLGSAYDDVGYDIAVDGSENVYVAGYSARSWGNPVNSYAEAGDAFVVKLDSNGETVWHTFIGSSETDYGYGIAVDESGNVYATGNSETGWGSPKIGYAGNKDAFVAKLDNNGALLWNTFMGSSETDYGYAIAVDGSIKVYVTGTSETGWGNPKNAYDGGKDVFVAKILDGVFCPGIHMLLLGF